MAIYGLGVLTTGVGSAAAAWELRTPSSSRSVMLELGFFLAAATASIVGFGRPQAIGITPGGTVTLIPDDSASPIAGTISALSWGTGPTVPTAFNRRVGLPATAGVGIIWTFPRGFIVPVSNSAVLWNVQANSALNAYVSEDE